MTTSPVLVVGAGPTGLAMAAELHRHGVPCRIVDKAAGPTDLSKATSVQARTLEVLEDMGLVDEVLDAGHQSHAVNVFSGSHRISHFRYDEVDSSYPFMLNIPQSSMERILGAWLSKLGVEVEWNAELTEFTQGDTDVTATLRHAKGKEETVRTPWLVGCDGADSIVRHTLGISFEGHTYDQWFGLADAKIAWDLRHDELYGFVHRSGLLFVIPMPGDDQYRLILEAHGRPADAELTLADFQAGMDERGPSGAVLSDPGWITPFNINARRAAKHGAGRVFIAGDSAHIHSPAGGQGMNTGIQDAYNLAWKLALVSKGAAGAALLDSFDAERTPVAEAVLKMTDRLTGILTLTNPIGRELRNHLMPVLTGLAPVQHVMATQDAELDITYRKSPAVSEHSHGRFGHRRFASGPRAGDRAPDASPIRRGNEEGLRLFDLLRGVHYSLLLFGGPDAEAASWSELLASSNDVRGARGDIIQSFLVVEDAAAFDQTAGAALGETTVLLDDEGALHHRYAAEMPCAYLIRPDGYIGFRSRPANGDALNSYLADVLGPA